MMRAGMKKSQVLVRPLVRRLRAYVPGEQPRVKGLVKLNTNENPYPPSPRVLAAVRAAVDERLRLYPDPTARALREALAEFHQCGPENIIVGNGADELLALATRAFVEPAVGRVAAEHASVVQFFAPSYGLYPVLAAIHGARAHAVPLEDDFSLPSLAELRWNGSWDSKAALTYVTTPNSPTGRGYATKELAQVCKAQEGVVILDETYADFASENALGLALKHPHVIVARTFSKAYSLCFQRVGYFVGHPELIKAMDKVRDSYNVNGLGQVAALATLTDLGYYRRNFRRIIATRDRISMELAALGFNVLPSQTNFIFVRPPVLSACVWLERLREQKVLVRWFDQPGIRDGLRISIGTDVEMDILLRAVKRILKRSC
jgi:histidinol-phosphate aminotransferase